MVNRKFRINKESKMLKHSTKAPEFTLKDQEGNDVSLADFKGQKVVLWFFPKADTPG